MARRSRNSPGPESTPPRAGNAWCHMLRQDLVLSVSPARKDHVTLRQLLEGHPWVVRESNSLRSALMVLEQYRIPVVLCEAELHPGSWRDLLAQVARTANTPSVI